MYEYPALYTTNHNIYNKSEKKMTTVNFVWNKQTSDTTGSKKLLNAMVT